MHSQIVELPIPPVMRDMSNEQVQSRLALLRQTLWPFAEIKNRDGYFIKASPDSVTAAMATATIPEDFRFSIVNAPGAGSYPIAGATWLLVYEKPQDLSKGRKLVEFLKWAETEGEKMAADLSFAPLPESLRNRVLKVLDTLGP